MSTMPNFLIIGAAKAGTTFLWSVLRQHPDIFLSEMKEPRFFAFENCPPRFGGPPYNDYTSVPTITRLSDYQALFAEAGAANARGEASTVYMYHPQDRPAERIRHYLPNVRLIALLRQPAERAFSNFVHAVSSGWEPHRDFTRALAEEPRRIRENWSYFLRYRHNSDYLSQLTPYFRRFDRRRIHVCLYDDLCADPLSLVRDIFRFLEVDDTFLPDLSRPINVSYFPRHRALHQWFRHFKQGKIFPRLPRPLAKLLAGGMRRMNLVRPAIPHETRQQLTEEFARDRERLQELIGRDLSLWARG